MIAEWLQRVPVFVWLALAVVLIVCFVVIFMVAGKRSREVDELEKAFNEPYHPPQNEVNDQEQIATEKQGSEEEEAKSDEATDDEPPKDPPTVRGSKSRHRGDEG